MLNDSLIDPRALREIYLAPFEKAVRDAKPWTVMAAYNQLNGLYCCEQNGVLQARHMILEMPLRSVVSLSEGRIPHHGIQGLILWANGRYGQALKTWSGSEAI